MVEGIQFLWVRMVYRWWVKLQIPGWPSRRLRSQVGPGCVSARLRNSERYPYFTRSLVIAPCGE